VGAVVDNESPDGKLDEAPDNEADDGIDDISELGGVDIAAKLGEDIVGAVDFARLGNADAPELGAANDVARLGLDEGRSNGLIVVDGASVTFSGTYATGLAVGSSAAAAGLWVAKVGYEVGAEDDVTSDAADGEEVGVEEIVVGEAAVG